MTWKTLNFIMSVVLILGAVGYVLNLHHSASQTIFFASSGVGPTYFPNILAGLLVMLSLVSLVRNLRDSSPKNTARIVTENAGQILATLALTVAFVASWQFLGYFYLNAFVLLTVLLTIYRIEFGFGNSIRVAVGTSAGVTAFLYVLFGNILEIAF